MKRKSNTGDDMIDNEVNEHGTNNLTLKNCATDDRPREKLIAKGKKELSNAELLAILLGSGTVGQNAVELAKEILRSNDNDLTTLSKQSIKDLTKDFKGMGEAKAVTVIAALELGYRMLSESNSKKTHVINDSNDLFRYISPSLVDLPYEEFWAIYMNIKKVVIFKKRICVGGITDTPVDIRRIFSTALEKNAVYIAVAHNHPSGDISPSKEDRIVTKRLEDACPILNMRFWDHIIVGSESHITGEYYSIYNNMRLNIHGI